MSRIFVHGWGAVSPAGWGIGPLRDALAAGTPLPLAELSRPGAIARQVRRVPAANPRPAWLAQPRLRRSSLISHFTVGAALEALGGTTSAAGPRGVGVICSVMGGSVTYSRRFYDEVLRDPATASPLIFPETVFNAPSSHLSALLGSTAPNDTLVSDQTGFAQALALAADWLDLGLVESCLVVAAEEADWLTAEAAAPFRPAAPPAEGAGALWLRREPGPVELTAISDPEPYTAGRSRAEAVQAVARRILPGAPTGLSLVSRHARGLPPAQAGVDPVSVLGDGLAAAGAWACVAAVDALTRSPATEASVVVAGSNLQAIGACFRRG